MAQGTLKKDTFLWVSQNVAVKMPKGTRVAFTFNPHPTVYFIASKPVKAIRVGNLWFLELFGERHPIIFDHKNPPYPFSYFK